MTENNRVIDMNLSEPNSQYFSPLDDIIYGGLIFLIFFRKKRLIERRFRTTK